MANIKLIRVDFRLIHGQIVNKWIKSILADKIVVIDDALATNDFLKSVYVMAAPPSVEVVVYGVEDAIKAYQEDVFGSGSALVLFKNVETAHQCYHKGFKFDELQIGGLGGSPGRKVVFGPITLDDSDVTLLEDLDNNKVNVYFHQVPEENKCNLAKALENYRK